VNEMMKAAGKRSDTMKKLDILDYSVYGNEADGMSDSLLKAASEASGYGTRIIPLAPDKALPHLEKRVWLRYDLRSGGDLARLVEVAESLETSGRLVFPQARSIMLAEDKWETHLALVGAGAPPVESHELHVTPPPGKRVVLKPRVGWGGMGMSLLEDGAGGFPVSPVGQGEYIWQPFIPHRHTWTIVLAGDSPIAVLEKRANSRDFRTNAGFGEEAVEVPDPGGAAAMAARALKAVGLAAGGVDMIGEGGRLRVLEVNSAPCLWYDNLPGLDLAGPMVRCVMEWMEGR